jgi:superfamily I DNA/RNA helicase
MGDGDISGKIVGMSEWRSYGLLSSRDDIVAEIANFLSLGYKPEEVCVLSRNHAELEIMKERLDQAEIKCQHVRPPSSLLRSKEMRFVLAALSLAGNRNDWRAATTLHLATGGDPALVKHGCMDGLTIPKEITGELTQEQAIRFAGASGLDSRTLEACDNFLLKVRYENGLGSREVPEFLAINRHGDSVTKPEPGVVTLRTVHGAKGLEWDCVAIVGMEDGAWPSKTSAKEGREDEERRLAYVAVTRARKMLVVCRPVVASEYVNDMQSKMQGEE